MFRRKVSSGIAATFVAAAGTLALLFALRGPVPAQASPSASIHCVTPTGLCTLSQCAVTPGHCHTTVQAALNAAGPGDEIRVAAGRYTGVQTLGGGVQLVYISKTVTVRGGYTAPGFANPPDPENNPAVLDAEGQGRVIYITGDISPAIEGLRITGGDASAAIADVGYGGGIYVQGSSTVSVSNGTIVSNTATNGGGIHNGGVLHVSNSTIVSNTATSSGGGIDNNRGVLHVSDSAIVSNTAAGSYGGGIRIYASASSTATATLTSSDINGNVAGNEGSGIFVRALYTSTAIVMLDNSTVCGNWADSYGGGIEAWPSNNSTVMVTISNSTIVSNTAASDDGGGIEIYAHVGSTATVTLNNTTISGNTAGGGGGGIEIYAGSNSTSTLTVNNTTVSGNSAGEDGGGICHSSGATSLAHATITDNAADSNGDDDGEGGGICHSSGPVILRNTIVAGNSDDTPSPGTIHPDISGDVTGNAYNLIGDATGGTGTAGTGSDIITSTIGIGPLADNGGLSTSSGQAPQTHALLGGSPAIDAVPVVSCILTTDQRGQSRPVDGDLDGIATCDIGAYEFIPHEIYLPLVVRNG